MAKTFLTLSEWVLDLAFGHDAKKCKPAKEVIMEDHYDEDGLLIGAVSWQKRKKTTTSKLGDSGRDYLGRNLQNLKRNAVVVDVWQEILPAELNEHSRLKSISGGVLELEVDPGPYMHEMRLISSELLEHLQNRCGRGKIKKIKLRPRK